MKALNIQTETSYSSNCWGSSDKNEGSNTMAPSGFLELDNSELDNL